VTATEPVTVWKLFGTSFRELEKIRPDVSRALQEAMRQRLASG
jgi:CRP-like cAMP-binding protein